MPAIAPVIRARRAAIAIIGPLVEGTVERRGGIPAVMWRRPYTIGFLVTLITLVARLEVRGRIGSEQLARVQLDAWQRITGISDDRIGEEICALSAEGNGEFLAGCRNGERLIEQWFAPGWDHSIETGSALLPAPDETYAGTADADRADDITASWHSCFDEVLDGLE